MWYIHPYDGIVVTPKKKCSIDPCDRADGPGKHDAEGKKSDAKATHDTKCPEEGNL